MNNFILEYYQAITSGMILAGAWVIKAYAMVIRSIESGAYVYSPKHARKAILFIERFCRHHEGPLAPGLIRLELWEKALISCIFGILDKDGLRQFREILIICGRKNGKTLLMAAISAYCAIMDGEYGARVYMAAPKLEQASLCYDAFFQMISTEPELKDLAKKRRSDVYFPGTNSSVKPIAFNAKKSDGLNISCCIADEIASWQGEAGIKFFEVLRSSFGARKQPLLICISTANYINDGIYDELMKRATAVLNGSSKENRLLPILYMIDDVSKWNDINEISKANPNLGVSISVDYLLEEIAIAEGSLSKRAEFLTKYCNVKQNASQAWLEFQTVEKCMGEHLDPEQLRGSYCVGGIDLSQTVDLTSACVVIEKAGKLHVLSHFWMPESRLETATAEDGVPYQSYVERGFLSLSGENFVDYQDVYKWFTDLVEKYEILPLQIGYDRYSSQYLIADLKAYGFHVDDVYQGTNLTPVLRQFEGEIKDGAYDFGDNSLLQSHLLNSALKLEAESQKVKLIKVGKRTRIDGAAALMDALTVRHKWAGEIGEQLRNE